MQRRLISSLLIAAVLGLGLWYAAKAIYLQPKQAMQERLHELNEKRTQYQDGVKRHAAVLAQLDSIAGQTLGGDQQSVDHRLRSRLNRLTEEIGLTGAPGATVGTGAAVSRTSPAAPAYFSRSGSQGALRSENDFIEVEGWVRGEGSLESALLLPHRLRSEPWVHRIETFDLTPKDDGRRFDVSLRFRTLFLPGREVEEPGPALVEMESFAPYAALASHNPFAQPAPPQPTVAQNEEAPAESEAAAPPPSTPWVLTGLTEGPNGVEAWLVHQNSRESRMITIGEKVDPFTFVSATETQAMFQFGERTFAIELGSRIEAPPSLTMRRDDHVGANGANAEEGT